MKPVKKILALILAGVMALALLTGCGKATSLNRTMAEGLAEYAKSSLAQQGNKNNISVSYQVPELSRDIAPLFDENWITQNDDGDNVLNENYKVNGNKTVKETLTGILNRYMSDSFVVFFVTDVKTPFMEGVNWFDSSIDFVIRGLNFDAGSITSLKIEVTHKTVNGRTYALAVIIYEA